MTDAFAHVNGNPIASAVVHVPHSGAWFADVVWMEAPPLSGRVTLTLGDVELVGTIDERFAGTRGGELRARIVAGAAGWGSAVAAQSYVNDQGVRALLVAQDAARLAGETLGTFSPSAASLGSYYVRQAGPAARVLEDVIGSASWWVEFDGTTTVGTRTTSTARDGTYQVLEYDAAARLATIAVDDVSAVAPGSVLSGGLLDEPQTVRDLEIRVTPDGVRLVAWTGATVGARGRLEGAFRSVVQAATGRRLHGVYAYRVQRLAGDRVELQAIDRTLGLPDLGPTPMWAGLAGAHATLTLGCEVLVQFVNGDRTRPVVTGFVGKGGPGFAPTGIDLGTNPTDFVALASKVLTELNKIRTWANTHTHGGVTAGGAASGSPVTPLSALTSPASTLVRST